MASEVINPPLPTTLKDFCRFYAVLIFLLNIVNVLSMIGLYCLRERILLQDTYKILKILKENNGSVNSEQLANIITEGFNNEISVDPDRALIDLVFMENPKQEDLDKCLNEYDIEVAGGHRALMLAYFMKMHPELEYSNYVEPRLKGLLQFYRFQNLKLVSHFTRICSELKKSKIDFLIFKGGCMKHLRPEYPRVMGDIDILVHEKDFVKAGEVAKSLGYDIDRQIHSIDLHPKGSQEGIMDIHKYIIMHSNKEKAFLPDLFKRATKQKVFNIETLVPCNEDLLFISLVNMVRNLRERTSSAGILYTIFDCRFLIESKPEFNWDIVIQNAKKTKTELQISLATLFINTIVPGLLPEKVQKDSFFEYKFRNYCLLLIFQNFYFPKMQQKCRGMKIRNLFSSKDFFIDYVRLKPVYYILKKRAVKNNPYIAERVMKSAGVL